MDKSVTIRKADNGFIVSYASPTVAGTDGEPDYYGKHSESVFATMHDACQFIEGRFGASS